MGTKAFHAEVAYTFIGKAGLADWTRGAGISQPVEARLAHIMASKVARYIFRVWPALLAVVDERNLGW